MVPGRLELRFGIQHFLQAITESSGNGLAARKSPEFAPRQPDGWLLRQWGASRPRLPQHAPSASPATAASEAVGNSTSSSFSPSARAACTAAWACRTAWL